MDARAAIGVFLIFMVVVYSMATKSKAESPAESIASLRRVIPDPTPTGPINYINPNIPNLRRPEYSGERYEALAPATLDLAERGWLATNANTGFLNPNCDGEMYYPISYLCALPLMAHSEADLQTGGKFLEVIPLLRTMSGNMVREDVEYTLMQALLKSQGPDGMLYYPQKGRPWVVMKPGGDYTGGLPDTSIEYDQMASLSYGTGRALGAFCILAQKDPRGPWRDAARRLAEAFKKMTIVEGDKAYLFATWTIPGRPVSKPKAKPKGMFGGMAGWVANGLLQYDAAVGDQESVDLAGKLLRYVFDDMGYFAEDGRFLSDLLDVYAGWPQYKGRAHYHTHLMNVIPTLRYAERTGDKELLGKALRAYEWAAGPTSGGNSLVGFFPAFVDAEGAPSEKLSETCADADMVMAAVLLSRMGIDKWDDADRWLRNHLAEVQMVSSDWITDGHLASVHKKEWDEWRDERIAKGGCTTDRVVERTLGIHSGGAEVNDGVGAAPVCVITCCPGSAARTLFLVWRDMISHDQNRLRVHLLLNRASRWADIDSYIPFTGRVDVKVKQDLSLELRLPEWVKPKEAKCAVNGQARKLEFGGRYAKVGPVKAGQTAVMTFPIQERTEKIHVGGKEYTVILRGNEVVSMDPPGIYWPLYQNRGHYRLGRTFYRKVTRYLSNEEYSWW